MFCRVAWAMLMLVFKFLFAYLFGCHIATGYTYLATGLPSLRFYRFHVIWPLSDFILSSSWFRVSILAILYTYLAAHSPRFEFYRSHLFLTSFLVRQLSSKLFRSWCVNLWFPLPVRPRNLLECSPKKPPTTYNSYYDLACKIAHLSCNKSPTLKQRLVHFKIFSLFKWCTGTLPIIEQKGTKFHNKMM